MTINLVIALVVGAIAGASYVSRNWNVFLACLVVLVGNLAAVLYNSFLP